MTDSEFLVSVGIPTRYHTKTFDEFTNDEVALKKVIDYVERYETFAESGVGLFLWGSNGTGKSHLMFCAFKRLILKRAKVSVLSFSDLITGFIGGWFDEDKKRILETYKNVDFLCIEEIGKEHKSKENDLAKMVLDNILRYRVQMCKPTWFTSNIEPSQLAVNYSVDIASMMKEGCLTLHVTGEDYRGKINTKNKSL